MSDTRRSPRHHDHGESFTGQEFRAFDALIAATAVADGLPLYTANPSDFSGIYDLVVRTIPAPEPGAHRERQ